MAKHSEFRKLIKQEAEERINSPADLFKFTLEDFQKLVYCQAFIYESLRMNPPKNNIKRVAKKDFDLDGIKIKKNY